MLLLSSGLIVSACNKTFKSPQNVAIGPFESFEGRLLVMQPTRRWQVQIQWQGTANRGQVRLTHAASGRILYLRWQGKKMFSMDNQAATGLSGYHPIQQTELYERGLIIPPQQLANILHGRIPSALKPNGDNQWQGKLNGSLIRIQWLADKQKLTLEDITHGNTALLLIQTSD